jgi:hypothetical protein
LLHKLIIWIVASKARLPSFGRWRSGCVIWVGIPLGWGLERSAFPDLEIASENELHGVAIISPTMLCCCSASFSHVRHPNEHTSNCLSHVVSQMNACLPHRMTS